MSLRLGDTFPDFQAETTEGTIRFHNWLGENWGVLFAFHSTLNTRNHVHQNAKLPDCGP
jgi:alkyl hydroperoxide reductase subunit AhpC